MTATSDRATSRKVGKRTLPLPPDDGEWHVLHLPDDIDWYHLRSVGVILLRRIRTVTS